MPLVRKKMLHVNNIMDKEEKENFEGYKEGLIEKEYEGYYAKLKV